ncbi:hypothetical protein VSX64_25330, partial [Aurantimonas sp. C2-6-R+9]|uniref:hypothetical protein n=1 Tax=Aurantimonas sp. C2-6-R+9 TaxID=3114365 RepID=UPI002E19DD6D|nr:hypothetical protein [Aurantimonas sp. C2-6-R+9]
ISSASPKSPLPPFPGPRNLQPGNADRRSSTNFGTSPASMAPSEWADSFFEAVKKLKINMKG